MVRTHKIQAKRQEDLSSTNGGGAPAFTASANSLQQNCALGAVAPFAQWRSAASLDDGAARLLTCPLRLPEGFGQ